MLSGKVASISTKYLFVVLLVVTCVSIAPSARAQSWPDIPGNFLEPNRFGVVGETGDHYLWLEAGFGRDIVRTSVVNFGLEALFWSRLRNLSEFRFPVETADYFFGGYFTFKAFNGMNRVRISHISSHLVDGSDSVEPGSSSRFSKEFIQADRLYKTKFLFFNVFGSIGARYTFHQVTENEQKFTFPSSFNVGFYEWGKDDLKADSLGFAGLLFGTISANAGPSIPSASYGIGARFAFNNTSAFELFARYYDGRSRAGIEGERIEEQFEIGMRVIPFDWFD